MKNQFNLPCEWGHCGASASKHMRFGLRVFDAVGSVHISEIPYVAEHRNVCDAHAIRARNEYVYVAAYDLGQCPKCGARGITPHVAVAEASITA